VLFDRSYWSGLVDWLTSTVLERAAINATDLNLFTVTDDVAEAVEVMRAGIPDLSPPHRPE
jgi:predicted Rossmann-fold nucleotide-binding protein